MTAGRTMLILLVIVPGISTFSEEQSDHQRIAVETHRRIELFFNGGLSILPQTERYYRSVVSVFEGDVNIEIGGKVRQRYDFSVEGRVPIGAHRTTADGLVLGYTADGVVSFETGYTFGPAFRKSRIAASLDTGRAVTGSANVMFIRDPMVHGCGVVAIFSTESPEEMVLQMPLSSVLVTNDITSIQFEIVPLIRNGPTFTQVSFAAVISMRWGWDRFHVGASTVMHHMEGPSELNVRGGWLWKPES